MLTIGIPTWNRAHKLDACLDAFLREIATVPGAGVRILVSDNGSTDGTAEVVARQRARYPGFDCVRNETNIGASRNIWSLMQRVETEYLWLFGDDDLPHPGALARVLGLVEQTRAAAYLFSVHFVKRSGPAVEVDTLFNLCNRYGFLNAIGCLPTVMVRTEKLRMVPPDLHLTGVFAQSTIPFQAYAHDRAVLVRDPIVLFPQKTEADKLDDQRRWMAEMTLAGYFKLLDVFDQWFRTGVLTEKLAATFFHTEPNYLWDRYNILALQQLLGGRRVPPPEMLAANERLAHMLKDEAVKRLILVRHEYIKATINNWVTAHNLLAREVMLAEQGYGI